MPTVVTLSLISHTNVGKTTLARTLLRREVGEVLDQAHVTLTSEEYTLIETDGATLKLWDTPGFGDTRRLMRRLRREGDPLGWLLHQLWDRVTNRPLWCSQNAVRNIRDHADVVLYLVNAAEDPRDAGYVSGELELLTWIGRPALLLLNQLGTSSEPPDPQWRRFVESWPIVRGVLRLDAFTRCWVEEGVVLRRIVPLLDGDRGRAMESIVAAWARRDLEIFRECCERISDYLARVAFDRESPGDARPADGTSATRRWANSLKWAAVDRKRAIAALDRRLDQATGELMSLLIAAHGLVGSSAETIEERIRDYQVRQGPVLNERSGALAGAVLSGALGGLAADAMSGGLTLGGGMIAGGILGALGGTALGWGYRVVGEQGGPSVTWSPQFLDQLTRQALLRHLAVAHFGRGRGSYRDLEQPERWHDAVDSALQRHRDSLQRIWRTVSSEDTARAVHEARVELRTIVESAARDVLRDAYPHAAEFLGPPS